ncbi:MAG: hypothetical protein IT304_12785 [Dehalococcoidia bacterium]|nr:hypothetical protein [Dehalococcoidia bacterium]
MVVAIAILRPGSHSPFDAIGLLLRLVAYLFAVRAGIGLVLLGGRVVLAVRRRAYALAIGEPGLVLVTPGATHAVKRSDVLGIAERGHWQGRGARRFAPVYVVVRPGAGPTFLELPPIFEDSPGVLAERLMRWRGPLPEEREPEPVDPGVIASALYEQVAAGSIPEGTTAIRHGWRFLAQGPYATMMLAVALLDGWLRMGAVDRAALGWLPLVWLGITFLVVPLGWLALMWREIGPRRGLALVMTPSELLIRTRRGLTRVPWGEVAKVGIEEKTRWSVVLGQHARRQLAIERRDEDASVIRYDEHFLGAPAEVVETLVNAYRKGRWKLAPRDGAASVTAANAEPATGC